MRCKQCNNSYKAEELKDKLCEKCIEINYYNNELVDPITRDMKGLTAKEKQWVLRRCYEDSLKKRELTNNEHVSS